MDDDPKLDAKRSVISMCEWDRMKIIKNCIGQVVKMLVAVVVLFVICWGPILVDNMLTAYGYMPHEKAGTYKHLNTAFQLMAYFNR